MKTLHTNDKNNKHSGSLDVQTSYPHLQSPSRGYAWSSYLVVPRGDQSKYFTQLHQWTADSNRLASQYKTCDTKVNHRVSGTREICDYFDPSGKRNFDIYVGIIVLQGSYILKKIIVKLLFVTSVVMKPSWQVVVEKRWLYVRMMLVSSGCLISVAHISNVLCGPS